MGLKSNELRVGNIVRYYGNDNPLKIEHIDTRNIEGWLSGYIIEENSNCLNKNAISALEPIPLTEEWLIDFGFERGLILTGNKEQYGYSKDLLMMLRFQNSDNWYACPYGYPIGIERTLHVHQLQNLYFALTGKELTHQKIN